MPVDNDAALQAILLGDFQGIIDEVTAALLEKLKQKIDEEVYSFGPGSRYKRLGDNGGLRGEFDKSNAVVSGNTVISDIGEYSDRMVFNPDKYTHGSHYYDPEDIRSFLAEIIITGTAGDIFGQGWWTEKRDFWQPFIDLLENGEADNQIQKAMSKRGIKWKKI